MRRLLVVGVLALLLAVPASSQADRNTLSDGCLVVSNGQGIVTVSAHGGIFGRFDQGQVVIEDLNLSDARAPKVFGNDTFEQLTPTRTRYTGQNVRFRFTGGGAFRVSVTGIGIDLSAVGHGWANVNGAGFTDPGLYSADNDSLCSKAFKPLPKTPTRVVLGTAATG